MQHRTGRRAWKTILEDLQIASVRCDGWQGSGDHPDSGMDPRRGGGQAESLPTETLTPETSSLEDKERKHHVIPVWGRTRFYPVEKAMAPHSGTLAWKIPWTEEPGGLQSMGSLQVRYDWATSLSLFTFMHWRRKWQPTPVFLPGESQGPGSLEAAIYGVAQSRTRLKWLSSSSSRFYPEWKDERR